MFQEGFFQLTPAKRLESVRQALDLTTQESDLICSGQALSLETADKMVEHVIGTYPLPYAVATDMVINGKEYLVPMVGEEPYVTRSLSGAAKLAKAFGGFSVEATGPIMIAQVMLLRVPAPRAARHRILARKREIMDLADKRDPVLLSFGGGCQDLEVRMVDSAVGPMLVVHLLIHTGDAMGAQVCNMMAEAVGPLLEEITGGTAQVKILSNLAIHRLVRAHVCIGIEALGSDQAVEKILEAYAFAQADPFRAVTNNKGIMNGMIPVVVATGNDTRAVEAGCHGYASLHGTYQPLTVWERGHNGDLEGTLEIPMPVGIVGGTTKIHPLAQLSLKMMGISTATELAQVIAAIGLAANLAAMRSLTTGGIVGDFDESRNNK